MKEYKTIDEQKEVIILDLKDIRNKSVLLSKTQALAKDYELWISTLANNSEAEYKKAALA